MSSPAPEQLPVIATNLSRLRGARELSLEELAERAHLSALTLRRIEQGGELPPIDTLWSLANALGVSFSALIEREPAKERKSAPDLHGVPRRSLLPVAHGVRGQTELHEIKLAPHSEGLSPAGDPHTIESLLVTAGELVVQVADQRHVLAVGQSIEVPAYVERRYHNPSDRTAIVYAKLGRSEHVLG